MATKASRPGRVIAATFVVIAALYGGVAAAGDWKPRLGLDLQGGTRITLQAETEEGDTPGDDQMEEAKGIIEQRVNGTGVSEAEVAIQGDKQIIVEIPGAEKAGIVDQIGETAKLYFRLVWAQQPGSDARQIPQQPAITLPPEPQDTETGEASPDDTTNNRVAPGFDPGDDPTDGANGQNGGEGQNGQNGGEGEAGDGADWSQLTQQQSVDIANSAVQSGTGTAPEGYQKSLDQLVSEMNEFDCPPGGAAPQVEDRPSQPLVTCGEEGGKYVLSPALIEGTQLTDANATVPQQSVSWLVQLELDGKGTDTLADISRAMSGQNSQFAIVLDGQVLSAPNFQSAITDGNAQIEGNFTQASAQALANSLKYGALPLEFGVDAVTVEGPSLAGSQLDAGLLAAAFGFALVLGYSLLYYRGLGIVIAGSFAVAGATVYAMVMLLGAGMGFTLTLPGIAGLIVAVGITADSFIVFFERLRDEVRDGKSLRLAVELGWQRARLTILAADAVTLLAALILYIFAIGVVRGFAFALGLVTLIDLLVVFFFTKPLVAVLARSKFFGRGHKWSGLDAKHLGVEGRDVTRIAASARPSRPVGGEA